MICVDPMQQSVPSGRWPYKTRCHLFETEHNLSRLQSFAVGMGLSRSWFQDDHRLPHYDLTGAMRRVAIKHGAHSVKTIRPFMRRKEV